MQAANQRVPPPGRNLTQPCRLPASRCAVCGRASGAPTPVLPPRRLEPVKWLAALLLTLLASAPRADQDRAYELARSGEILPLEQVLQHQRRDRPGRILEVELEQEEGRPVYELELLDAKGQVWELHYDAVSGERLESEPERHR